MFHVEHCQPAFNICWLFSEGFLNFPCFVFGSDILGKKEAKTMKNYLMIGYEAAASLLPWAAVYFAGGRNRSRLSRGERRKRLVFYLVWAVYICVVLYFTGAGTLYDIFLHGMNGGEQINLLPFSRTIDWTAYFLNIVLFIPLGILLPAVSAKVRLPDVLLAGGFFSLLIELSQLFNNRSTDIDDLLLNMLGALLGYLVWKIWTAVTGWKGLDCQWTEPVLYFVVMMAGRFLFYNEIGLAAILYGF